MIDYYEPNIDLTLLGCGFLGTYHLGAICLLTQIWPHKPFNRVCGASSGGLLAALLATGLKLELVLAAAMNIIRRLRCWRKGRALVEALRELLPENAHELCQGRLGISVTKLWPVENRFVSEFESREDLIQAIAAGCYIPIWSGSRSFPKFRGQSCVDGAYTDNTPKFKLRRSRPEERCIRQVELCPFSGNIEVCPPTPMSSLSMVMMRILGTMYYMTLDNYLRCWHAITPLSVASYRPYMYEGHRDMKDFVLRNELVKCKQCYDNKPLNKKRSPSRNRDHHGTNSHSYSDSNSQATTCCLHCLRLLERVDSLELPEKLVKLCQ